VARLVKLIENMDLPKGVDVISINIPFDAKVDADIAITRPSLHSTGVYTREVETPLLIINGGEL